ncbi:MAG: PAS domain S-box protein, partial [Desulfuromonadales bacterium]|nr:PAS domain S-box protein [Desulfuromonadales bacterium]
FYPPAGAWFEVRPYPFPAGLSVHFHDITERKQRETALGDSEELYRTLVENIDLGITLIDENHRILMTNAAQGRLFGRSATDFVHQFCFRLFEGKDAPCPYCPGVAAMRSGQPASMETEGVHDDGSRFVVRVQAFPVFDPDGRARRFIEVVEDITARKRAQEGLRQSEERFRTLVEQAGDAFFLHEPDGRFIDFNRQACLSLGYSREELMRLTARDIEERFEKNQTVEVWADLQPGEVHTFRGVQRRKDHSRFPVEVRVSRYRAGDRDLIIALARDITERVQQEEALQGALAEAREARDKMDAILKSIADGLLVTDRHGRVIMMNRAAEALLGISFADAVNWPIADVIRDPAFDHQAGRSSSWEVTAEGIRRVLRARNFDMRAQGGKITGRITIVQDVTREHEIDRLKSEFLSTAAHELRTPLASIMGFTELLQQGELTPEQQEYLGIVYANSEDLSLIIDDLLNLSRIEAGRPVCLNLSSFDLRDEIARLVAQFRTEFPQHAFTAELPEPLTVWWDRAKIAQVLGNLLGNAVKFSPQGGPVQLEVRSERDQIEVTIRDLGIGMSVEQVERAFDIFYRGDASNTAVRGLGIGLSLARAIIEAHGGRIDVASTPGEGTRVVFRLPRGLAGDPPGG